MKNINGIDQIKNIPLDEDPYKKCFDCSNEDTDYCKDYCGIYATIIEYEKRNKMK